MPMRNEEKYCADLLLEFLRSRGLNAAFNDGPDPPDIDFEVNGEDWAVEHTQLFQFVDHVGSAESRAKIDSLNLDVERQIRAATEGQCKSGWLLALYGLLASSERAMILQAAIRSIREDSTSPFAAIQRDQAELMRIPDSSPAVSVLSMLPPTAKVPQSSNLSSNIQVTINYAVKCIFESKAPTLSQLRRYHRRVLLIQSQYLFANQRNLTIAVSNNICLKGGIDSIYLVTPSGICEVI